MSSETNTLGVKKFIKVESEAIILPYKDIDTDMIIPAEYLKTTTKEGLWKYAFINMKKAYSDFPEFWDKKIIVAWKNFWCWSSREHAPWALLDIGIKVIISSEFADIFRWNSEKNGLLLVRLQEEEVGEIMNNSWKIIVSLENQTVETQWKIYHFEINNFLKQKLINWLDDLDYILQFRKEIEDFANK